MRTRTHRSEDPEPQQLCMCHPAEASTSEAATTFAKEVGLTAPATVTQRDFLLVLGAWQRFEMLAEGSPDDAPALLQSLQRLVGKTQMGNRFKAWTCSFPETLPPPAGFPTAEADPAEG